MNTRQHSISTCMKYFKLYLYEDTITEEKHFSFIKDIKSYCQVFQCTDCHAFLTEYKKLKQHAKICQRPRIIFHITPIDCCHSW